MNIVTRFFHEMFNPHCPDCIRQRQEELEQKEMDREVELTCQSCESLKMQLNLVNQQNAKLLDKLVTTPEPITTQIQQTELKPLLTRQIPWNVKRQQLEQASREEALAKTKAAIPDAEKNEDIQKLEDAIGVTNASK